MALTLLSDFSTKTIIDSTEIQNEHENIANKFSGGITNADISSGAAIGLNKLGGRYQYEMCTWNLTGTEWAVAVPAYKGFFCLIDSITGRNPWTLQQIYWAATDCGTDNAAAFQLEYGYFAAGGAWTVVSTFGPYTLTRGTNDAGFQGQSLAAGAVSLAVGATPRYLRFYHTVLGAGWMTAATAAFSCTAVLRRDIQLA